MTTRDESPIIRTTPSRMLKGLAIMVGLIIIGTAYMVVFWQDMAKYPPPVSKQKLPPIEIERLGQALVTDLESKSKPPAPVPSAAPAIKADATLTILQGSSAQGNPDYDPDVLTVKKGNTIEVKNEDSVPHTVTSGTGPSDANSAKQFDTGIINGGESAILKTDGLNAGDYPYYCQVHPYMTGTLKVE